MRDLIRDKSHLLEGLRKWLSEMRAPKSARDDLKEDGDVSLNIKLWNAIMFGNDDDIRRLLDIGADPHAKNGKGHTALQLALMHGRSIETLEMFQDYATKEVKKRPKTKT